MVTRILLIAGLGFILAGCGQERACPDTGDSMLDSEAATVVTESEHPTGWGRAVCATCHSFAGLHRRGCSPEVDLAEVRAIVEEGGEAACAECHGDNGATD